MKKPLSFAGDKAEDVEIYVKAATSKEERSDREKRIRRTCQKDDA